MHISNFCKVLNYFQIRINLCVENLSNEDKHLDSPSIKVQGNIPKSQTDDCEDMECFKMQRRRCKKDYDRIDSVREKVCDYKLYDLPDLDAFTSDEYLERVPVLKRICFDLDQFQFVGRQMFDISAVSENEQEGMHKYWCG